MLFFFTPYGYDSHWITDSWHGGGGGGYGCMLVVIYLLYACFTNDKVRINSRKLSFQLSGNAEMQWIVGLMSTYNVLVKELDTMNLYLFLFKYIKRCNIDRLAISTYFKYDSPNRQDIASLPYFTSFLYCYRRWQTYLRREGQRQYIRDFVLFFVFHHFLWQCIYPAVMGYQNLQSIFPFNHVKLLQTVKFILFEVVLVFV